MKYTKYIFVAIIVSFLIASCSVQDKNAMAKINLLNKINSNYYNLSNQNVKSIDFQYKSSKFDKLSTQINNKELASLVSNIEFIAQWEGGTAVSVRTKNIPNLKNREARLGLDKILSGTKTEIRGLFLIIAPALDNLVQYRNNVNISVKEGANGLTLELNHRFKKLKEVLYFDNNLKLLKTETYELNRLTSINDMQFDLYQGKYLLKKISTKIFSKAEMETEVEIKYIEAEGVNLPSGIVLNSTIGDRTTNNEIKLIPITIKK